MSKNNDNGSTKNKEEITTTYITEWSRKCYVVDVTYKLRFDRPIVLIIVRDIETRQQLVLQMINARPYFHIRPEELIKLAPGSTRIDSTEDFFVDDIRYLRVYVKIPADVGILRKLVDEVWDADIRFGYRIRADYNLFGIRTFPGMVFDANEFPRFEKEDN